MTNSNDFGEYYKTISNTELLSILENPCDYQAAAIEAAKKEFANRHLSDTEINEAKQPLLVKQLQAEKQKEKIKQIEVKIKKTGDSIIDTLNPVQQGIPTTEKTIRYIIIVLGGFFLYQLISDYRTILAYITDIPRFPFESSLVLFPFIIMPVAIITFWKRKPSGWVLLAIFLMFSIIGVLFELFFSITWKPSASGFDRFFPRPPLVEYIVQLVFLGGTLFVICKQNIREIFNIKEEKMLLVASITGITTFFITYVAL